MSGRNAERGRRTILREHQLVGNLYALRGDFLLRLREQRLRLPLNMEGDDGLLGALIKWNLDPRTQPFENTRIAPCAAAGFEFDSVSLTRPVTGKCMAACRAYGRSRYEFRLLAPRLKAHGLRAIPNDIRELYGGADTLTLEWNGVYTVTNWMHCDKCAGSLRSV